jgi:hypothetical protein
MKAPIVSSLRPSQDVAETLSKSLRVSELVGALKGDFADPAGLIAAVQQGITEQRRR